MKNLFLSRADFEKASKSSDLRDFILFLENTTYRADSTKEATIYEVEGVLFRNLLSLSEKIMSFVDEDIICFLKKRFMKYEVIAMEGVINSRLEDRQLYDFALSRDVKGIVEKAKDMEEFVAMLKDTRYGNTIVAVADDFRETGSAPILNLALERAYLNELWLSIGELPGSDRKMAREFIGIEMDTMNILTILRNSDPHQREKFIIPHYYLLREEKVKKCIKSSETTEVVAMLSTGPYRDLCKDIKGYEDSGSLLPVELNVKRYILNKSKAALSALSEDPMGIGMILAFLKLKEIEFENLRAIAVGVGNNLPPEEIRGMLVF